MTQSPIPAEAKMAIGRMFQMMLRPSQHGDIETYNAIRAIVLDAADPPPHAWTHNYARDRLLGAAGDN